VNQTPATGGYMIAAYVTTAVILLAYAASLWWRARRKDRA
jgi:hypothetical protein